MSKVSVLGLVCAGILLTMAPQARADAWNQRTIFTFSQPVEVPGQVLPAGTYVFKLLNSQSNRDIVQVFNKNETHIFGTFLAIPDYRLKPSGKTIITFEERAAGAPEAVKAWFYPGFEYGHEFVYPKAKAMALAQANNQPVPAMPNEMAVNTTKEAKTMHEASVQALEKAPLKAEQPSQQEVEVTQVFPPPPPQQTAQATPPAEQPLPHTASPLPLLALLGLVSLGSAAALRRSARRS